MGKEQRKEEYIQKYARYYCNGDVEKAKEHALVKLVCKEYDKDIPTRPFQIS